MKKIFAASDFCRNWETGKLLYLMAFLAVFVSSCGPPKNATLLYKDNQLASNYLVWSPSGDELAVSTNRGNPPVTAIYILDVKIRKIRLVVNQNFGHVYAQGWTPDGKQLTFSAFSFKDSKQGTWLADPNGIESPKFLTIDAVLAWTRGDDMVVTSRLSERNFSTNFCSLLPYICSFDGAFGAESAQLLGQNGAFWQLNCSLRQAARKDHSTQEISLYLHNIKTNVETNIFSGSGIGIAEASWPSDSSKLVFQFEKSFGGHYGIYVFDANTKKTIQVIPDGNVMDPSLSPDGKMIAYRKGDPKGSLLADYLHIMKSDGSCDVEVPGRFVVFSPVWSPDGKQIAYIGQNDQGIYLLNLAGAFGEDIVEKGLPCP